MTDNLVDLNDEDLVKIGQVSYDLQQKFRQRQWHSRTGLLRLMDEIEKDATERFRKIGFGIEVDTSPMIAGQPPNISIARKLGSVFDFEKKVWEVEKSRDRNESIYNEKKNPMGKTVTGE